MNEKIGAITRTQMSLVQLNYETFGKSTEEISNELSIQKSVVEALVEEKGWKQNQNSSASSDSLTDGELKRQQAFLPEYVKLENTMIGIARDYLDSLDIDDENFDRKFSTMVKAIKDMRNTTSVAASQASTAQAQANAGIQLNIINQFQ